MTKKVRLVTGIILFAFLTSHLINLSFGLISLSALDQSREWVLIFWATKPGIALLVGSMMAHLMLGLTALYQRNTLRMTTSDWTQLILGLLIFPLLFGHLMGTVIGPMMTGTRQSYFSILSLFWVYDPVLGLKQVIVTVITWVHGCMGLVIWMRIQSWWSRVAGFTYPLVVAIPLLALLGMVEAGKEVIELNKDPVFAKIALDMLMPSPTAMEKTLAIVALVTQLYLAVVALVFLARYIRVRKDSAALSVTYADGTRLEVKSGLTLLEISRMNAMPHASLCGGKGRCGTCRVRVHEGMDLLPGATEVERKTLDRIKAGPDVRLACQVVPHSGAISIERLMPAYIEPKDLHSLDLSDDISGIPGDGNPVAGDAK